MASLKFLQNLLASQQDQMKIAKQAIERLKPIIVNLKAEIKTVKAQPKPVKKTSAKATTKKQPVKATKK